MNRGLSQAPAPALALALLISSACEPGGALRSPAFAASSSPIVNGTRDPTVVALAPDQVRAIGWLHTAGDPTDNFCTATLVAPNVVVTAQHCTEGSRAGDIGWGIGLDPANADDSFDSVEIYEHPSADAALIVLSRSATLSADPPRPIAINRTAIAMADIGKQLEAGGYGDTLDANRTGRWFAGVYLSAVDQRTITVDGRGQRGICFGDSGGPALDTDPNGAPMVLAVESFGDDTCVDEDTMVRLDAVLDWIDPVLAGGTPLDPCEGLDFLGRCTGNISEWCDRGRIRQRDCGALGTTCGYLNDQLGHVCLCGELDYLGRCDNNVAEYCDEGRITRVNCERRDQACGWVDQDIGYYCTDTPMCLPRDEEGRCAGDVLIECSNNMNTRTLCVVDGLECGMNALGVAACVDPNAPPDAGVGEPDSGAAAPDAQISDTGIDAGTGGGADAAETARDAGPQSEKKRDESCGCATAESGPRPGPGGALLLIACLLIRGSSRRRCSSGRATESASR